MVYAPFLFYVGFLGFSGVIAGTVGAHGLSGYPDKARDLFKTAAHYQTLHATASIGAVALAESLRPTNLKAAKWVGVAAGLFAAGTSLFSFTIYATTLGAPKALGPLTPLGGLLMMSGWCTAMLSALAL
jgi:uncharacterized membrane protein YgdD (TMEM256/DUF423 family)